MAQLHAILTSEPVRNYIYYHTSSIRDTCLYMFVFLYIHSNVNLPTTVYDARLIKQTTLYLFKLCKLTW
jgi:hypothetical protein